MEALKERPYQHLLFRFRIINSKLAFKFQEMKRLLFLLLFMALLNSYARAQIKYALVGINGLTCSACSYATQRSLQTLPFVKSVEIGLNTTIARITFVPGKEIDLDAIARKVDDAAFSVRSFNIISAMPELAVENGFCYVSGNKVFTFAGISARQISGEQNLKLVGKNFMSKAEYKSWMKKLVMNCKVETSQKQYYVTL